MCQKCKVKEKFFWCVFWLFFYHFLRSEETITLPHPWFQTKTFKKFSWIAELCYEIHPYKQGDRMTDLPGPLCSFLPRRGSPFRRQQLLALQYCETTRKDSHRPRWIPRFWRVIIPPSPLRMIKSLAFLRCSSHLQFGCIRRFFFFRPPCAVVNQQLEGFCFVLVFLFFFFSFRVIFICRIHILKPAVPLSCRAFCHVFFFYPLSRFIAPLLAL